MIAEKTAVRCCAELVQTKVDDELVMMDLATGDCYGISGAGIQIWGLLKSEPRVCDIVSQICSEYDVSEDRCFSDVQQFLEHLKELNLVEYQ